MSPASRAYPPAIRRHFSALSSFSTASRFSPRAYSAKAMQWSSASFAARNATDNGSFQSSSGIPTGLFDQIRGDLDLFPSGDRGVCRGEGPRSDIYFPLTVCPSGVSPLRCWSMPSRLRVSSTDARRPRRSSSRGTLPFRPAGGRRSSISWTRALVNASSGKLPAHCTRRSRLRASTLTEETWASLLSSDAPNARSGSTSILWPTQGGNSGTSERTPQCSPGVPWCARRRRAPRTRVWPVVLPPS